MKFKILDITLLEMKWYKKYKLEHYPYVNYSSFHQSLLNINIYPAGTEISITDGRQSLNFNLPPPQYCEEQFQILKVDKSIKKNQQIKD